MKKQGKNTPKDPEVKTKSEIALREEETLAFWQKEKIFEKSLAQTEKGEPFVFYDGPPFATGLPHYGHFLPNLMKDVIPRYQTMRGRYVRRVWGWDCHGLPIENLIEKELGLAHKKDIEEFGIGKFNDAAQASVLRYDTEWKKMIPRIGRWVDMEHAYRTMDANYTESIWWAFKTLYDKGLIYRGFKAMHICPRCETTLSANEVAEGYKDIKDISVTVKFRLKNPEKLPLTIPANASVFMLAWTTTPWTLPGNVALAVNQDIDYRPVLDLNKNEVLIVSDKYRTQYDKFHTLEYSMLPLKDVAAALKSSDLVGLEYEPPFDYYSKDTTLKNHKTAESGTGIVHIAPAFGEDDMALGKKENLPFVQHVGMDGVMKPEVRDFAGMAVKPKSEEDKERLATDIAVLKYLQDRGTFFSKENIMHSYPHCWRCDTPLLNYAAESWFVKVSALREKLLAENAKTSWVPQNMRDGRFGKWLENARDWAISRARYWGAPLPVWTCDTCTEVVVFGSRAELAAQTKKSGNRYLVMRHGEAESNIRGIVSSKLETSEAYPLTAKGRKEAETVGAKFKKETIDVVACSPFARTKETAEIVARAVGFDVEDIVVDERIQEIDTGVFDGRSVAEYRDHFSTMREKFEKRPLEGENLIDIKRRVMAFFDEMEAQYKGKTILIVTHEYPSWMLVAGSMGATIDEALALKENKEDFILPSEMVEVPYVPFPHNADFEFDIHRPYIDDVQISCACGGQMKRSPFVFDCWFESGSMPFAQLHYPFENKDIFEKNFPADFIAEGVDQTRGWFYNMLVLATGIFGKTPFKNVIVNGMVLAEDGQKMSKRLKNYPAPWYIIDRYGADAVRYYLLSSPIVHAEDLAFAERGVDEVVKKVIVRTVNVLSFYELYRDRGGGEAAQGESSDPLDRWIRARLAELAHEMTESLDAYELDRAVKPIGLFVDDLSTWYLRRSRERFKSDDAADRVQATLTTRIVFIEFSKLLAPIMPFLAEHVYQSVGGGKESVHLESWPGQGQVDETIIADMGEVRRIVSLALEARAKAGMKVRQPLRELKVKSEKLKVEYVEIIKDEVNVKEVVFDEAFSEDVTLDLVITSALKREGQFRDLVRSVQELRKYHAFTPSDTVVLCVETDDHGRQLVEEFSVELKKISSIRSITYGAVSGEEVLLDGISMKIALEK